MDIYVQKDGRKHGPFSEAHIRRGIDAGEFSADDPAWTQGKASWQPLFDLIRLDVTQPPPISASVAVPNVPRLSESSSAPPSIVNPIDPTPLVEGRWKRQYNCRRCHAPFRTLTLGRWKVTDNCGECNAKHNRIITACFAVFLIAAFVADKILDHENKDQLKKAEAYVSSLSNPRPHATPDDNAFLFPPSTPRSITGSYPKLRNEPIVFPTIPPLPSPSTTPAKETAVLRSSEKDFKARYGEPDTVMHEGPVETDTFVYEVEDWIVRVGFWKELAQHIAVAKADRTPMTESDADAALSRFAEQQRWSKVNAEIGKNITGWDSGDATALLEIYHYKANDGGELQSTLLRIMTDDFYREYNKSILSK